MADKNIKSILLEERSFPPPADFTARARIKPQDLAALRERARADHVGFWSELAARELTWHTPFTVRLDDREAPNYRWFSDGRLNASYNCLDVHLAERGHKTAVIFEGEPGDVRRLSYRELHAEVCRFANALKARGVTKGDRVIIYMPLVPEVRRSRCTPATASAPFTRWCSAASRRRRSRTASRTPAAKLVITADGGWRGGNAVELKADRPTRRCAAAAPASSTSSCYKRTGKAVTMKAGRDLWWHDVIEGQSPACEPECGGRRASAVPALHLRLHRQAQGHPALDRRLPAGRQAHHAVGVRPARRGRVLVHGRRRLGDRPQLRRLRPARRRRHRGAVRRRARPIRTAVASGRSARRTASPCFYTAPTAIRALMKLGDDVPAQVRPVEPAPARLGRRADQSRSVDVVPPRRSAAGAARSSTPGGRPRPAAT